MLGPGVVSNSLTILGAHADLVSDDPSAGPLNRDAVTGLYFRRLASGTSRTAGMISEQVSPWMRHPPTHVCGTAAPRPERSASTGPARSGNSDRPPHALPEGPW